MLAKLTYKNQLTIPKALLKRLPKTNYFQVEVQDDALLLRPAEVRTLPIRGARDKPKWPEPVGRVLQTFIERVKQAYGARLAHIIVYGSYARGDQRKFSDLDVLVVLREMPEQTFWTEFHQLHALGYEASFGQDIPLIVSVMPVDEHRFAAGETPHLEAAKREGIPVA